jgi:uncharacterized protein YndB with AHSA1/START domain
MPESESKARWKRPGDEAVQAATGKTWTEWFSLLDGAGASQMNHKEIVAILDSHGVGPWWRQMVTVGYEQERGLRELHEMTGGYEISRSKTIAAPMPAVEEAFTNDALRRRWLVDADFIIRKATPGKTLRVTWVDGRTHVTVYFYKKEGGKTQVNVQHTKLADGAEAERMKDYWEDNLGKLKEMLETM